MLQYTYPSFAIMNKQGYGVTKAVPCPAPKERNANNFSTLGTVATHLIILESG